jgi:HSP20 family protein
MATLWNPWREMEQLANYEWWPTARRPVEFPAINAWESKNGLVLTTELPGVDAAQIDVALEKDTLTISGKRQELFADVEDENFVRRERWFEPFNRTVELPFDVDPEKCEATYEKGILTIKLERAPEQQPRKLNIKAS